MNPASSPSHRSEIDIWTVSIAPAVRALERQTATLSGDEMFRARKFVSSEVAGRFIAARSALRTIISGYTNVAPSAVVFEYGPWGKPRLPGEAIHFNLSHTGDLAAIAISRNFEIGVDIEVQSELEDDVARFMFSSAEYQHFSSLPPEQRRAAFFRYWTVKEAYVKAVGLGFSLPLGSFEVAFDDPRPPHIALLNDASTKKADCILFEFEPSEGVSGAIALLASRQDVTLNFYSDLEGLT